MFNKLERVILAEYSQEDIKKEETRSLSFLKFDNNSLKFGRLILIVFDKKSKRPLAVAKLYRNRQNGKNQEREFRTRSQIYDMLSAQMQQTVPAPIKLLNIDENCVMLEEFIYGETMLRKNYFKVNRTKMRIQIEQVSEWVRLFNRMTNREEIIFDNAFFDDNIKSTIGKFVNTYSLDFEMMDYIKWFIENGKSIFRGVKLPVVALHGDINCRNVLFYKGRVGIVDWENCKVDEHPLIDIFHFFASCGLVASGSIHNRENINEGLKYAFFSDNWLSWIVREQIINQCNFLNIPVECIPEMFFLSFVNLSMKQYMLYGEHYEWDILMKELVKLFVKNRSMFIFN